MVYDDAGFAAALNVGLAAMIVEGDFSEAVAYLCNEFYRHPTREMGVLGVTGTNGKTTTAWLVRDMLLALGKPAAYLGTLGFELPGEHRDIPNTTPFAADLYEFLGEARDRGVDALAMEVSSHALAQSRLEGVEFDAAVFTNLTQDHLDFHGSMEEYAAAKFRLFEDFPEATDKPFCAAINRDDPYGEALAQQLEYPVIGYGIECRYELWPTSLQVSVDRIEMDLNFQPLDGDLEAFHVSAPLGGHYNVENLLSATAGMWALGFEPAEIAGVVGSVRPVPGRFEPVANDQGIGILVDYAHTPDALEKLLDAVRPLCSGRILTVFGCGGDRDRTKRPKMAAASSERSDITIVTSDNPRTEDPQAIIDEVLTGLRPGAAYETIIDRREAIRRAVTMAEPSDVVVIAGKGHEDYQIIGREKFPMDDREEARAALLLRSRP